MKIIKKYDQYIKENKKVNEDIENEIPSFSDEEEFEDGDDSEIEPEAIGEEGVVENDPTDIDLEEEEEEGHQYNGTMMLNDLANKLGAEVVNNQIEFEGNKINFFSETEMYHVGNKKFKTADEVVNFLQKDEPTLTENPADIEHPEMEDEPAFESKSYRNKRKFKNSK